MSLKEVAAHYRMSETSVRAARGDFVELKRVRIGRRILILRSSVEALDSKLVRIAKAASDSVDDLLSGRLQKNS